MSTLDTVLFFVAVISIIAFGVWKGKSEDTQGAEGASEYFLAGRGLTWWLVGFSLIAANISTEQFVGMSGQAADWLGMAIASYEWMAAITLVVVALVFLPALLRAGIFTIPEFLEHRFTPSARLIMALASMVIIVGVPTASVIFSGAKVVSVFFSGVTVMGLDLGNLTVGCWIIGLSAALYVFVGGLKACAWTDLIWGVALILGGAVVMGLAFQKLGQMPASELIATKVATSTVTVQELEAASPFERFVRLNEGEAKEGPNLSGGKLHMIRPASDPAIPWTALIVGLWIPNFFYWGLNQYIMQRTLGSKSLAEGQKGIVFAAALKLVIPFIVVIPGILAFNLFRGDLQREAAVKNAPILAEVESGAARVFPFSQGFATVEPGAAQRVFAHNARVLGKPATAPSEGGPEALQAANADLVASAAAARIATGSKLVGYDYDAAFPTLLRNLLKPGITWFVLAAIFGAVVSSLASMLNAASTIATMDLVYKVRPKSTQSQLVAWGRGFVVVFVIASCLVAPGIADPKFGGVFTFIQEFQGFISPGVLAVFLFGFLVPRAPRMCGWLGIAVNIVLYGALKLALPEVAFLNRMAICFGLVVALLGAITVLRPLAQPVVMPSTSAIPLETSPSIKWLGAGVVIVTLALYAYFW
jgi:SSS family solute:Na+ symporter